MAGISIHALLAESDGWLGKNEIRAREFLSTLSLRRATCCSLLFFLSLWEFLSTLSLRRATTPDGRNAERAKISIHALLAESDIGSPSIKWDTVISIHALLAESDFPKRSADSAEELFLSTLSLRRATKTGRALLKKSAYFYPRSPCGERQLIV